MLHDFEMQGLTDVIQYEVPNEIRQMYQGSRRQVADSIESAQNGRRTCHLVMSYVYFHMLPGLPQGAGASHDTGPSTETETALDVR